LPGFLSPHRHSTRCLRSDLFQQWKQILLQVLARSDPALCPNGISFLLKRFQRYQEHLVHFYESLRGCKCSSFFRLFSVISARIFSRNCFRLAL
jgi:hypothetical protein